VAQSIPTHIDVRAAIVAKSPHVAKLHLEKHIHKFVDEFSKKECSKE
jgi:hypothetical protein